MFVLQSSVVDVTTNAAMWAGIVGFLSPVVIQFITNQISGKQQQAAAAFVFCLLVAIPTAYFAPNSDLNAHDYVKSALVIFVTAMASYQSLWKPVGVAPSTTSQ